MKETKTKDIIFIGLFAAILCVCAQISIPTPFGIPFTLQTFAVALCGYILGAKKGALTVLVYILLGTVGLPVFSGFGAGFSKIFG
ncbi:MAG: biotin transporter BioY, partial [Clostridia bacterium]|nr:biotin transporter BioY [Clostridia bacterium]